MISLQDTLYYVLIFGAFWFIVLGGWLIWQLISILRGVREVLNEVRGTIERLENALHGVRNKFEDTGRHFSSFAETIKDSVKNFTSGKK
jgi:hypothetical protein